MTSDTTAIATYLFKRVEQLGIQHVFGVPGDFNLPLLDFIEAMPKVNWVGCCNELNAAYAADGYARIKKKPGILVTTYGVGELSALNGISGSRVESVPIVHIVGMTGRPVQEKQIMIHHANLSEPMKQPDHLMYTRASAPFSCCTEIITDVEKATDQIDNVFKAVAKHNAPGYIYLPVDMFVKNLGSSGESALQTPLDLEVKYDSGVADKVASEVIEAIYASKNPSILVDTLAERFHAREASQKLVKKTGFWSYTTSLSKGSIDETSPEFVGVYNGLASAKGVADAVHSSDLVINIGPLLSDSNTGGFTRDIKDENLIMLHPLYVQIKGKRYDDVHFLPVLERVVKLLDTDKLPAKVGEKPHVEPVEHVAPKSNDVMSQTELVEAITGGMQPNDTLLVESGTFQFASQDVKFKENTSYISQIFYSSIGFTLPATLGAALAQRELDQQQQHQSPGRVLLVEGDGSAQMTIQELGTMIRQNLTPVVFLLNNDGYSIERAIWGPEQKYNDICPNWKWTKLCEAFGGTDKTVANHTVKSKAELDQLLKDDSIIKPNKLNMIEVMLDKFDYPWRLSYQVKNMGGKNRAMFEQYAKERGEA